jgi:hypothetical protein
MKQGDKIRMNTLAAGPFGVFNVGDVLTVGNQIESDTAESWVGSKCADFYVDKAPDQDPPGGDEKAAPGKPADGELTELVLRKMRKAELLKVCASDEFQITEAPNKAEEVKPVDELTNKELVNAIMITMAAKAAADGEPGETGTE